MDRLIKSVANLLFAVDGVVVVVDTISSILLLDEEEAGLDSATLACLFNLFVMDGLGLAATVCEGTLESLLLLTLLLRPLT